MLVWKALLASQKKGGICGKVVVSAIDDCVTRFGAKSRNHFGR